ncbi:hypothetical protein QYF36_004910 [Acer negundo]|nr:hypothetical protein QYF36_004910 [Acer negundo]
MQGLAAAYVTSSSATVARAYRHLIHSPEDLLYTCLQKIIVEVEVHLHGARAADIISRTRILPLTVHLIFPLLISIATSIDGFVICDGVTIAFFGSEQSHVGDCERSTEHGSGRERLKEHGSERD